MTAAKATTAATATTTATRRRPLARPLARKDVRRRLLVCVCTPSRQRKGAHRWLHRLGGLRRLGLQLQGPQGGRLLVDLGHDLGGHDLGVRWRQGLR
jgi:hypothetical protein